MAKIITKILHNINRVCYVFGNQVSYPVTDVTPTRISRYTLAQLRMADHIATEVNPIFNCNFKLQIIEQCSFFPLFQTLLKANCLNKISQMPVVLIPIHFDRDPALRIPSCARAIVLRPFLTNDFMTGVPVIPGTENLPFHVSLLIFTAYFFMLCSYYQVYVEA